MASTTLSFRSAEQTDQGLSSLAQGIVGGDMPWPLVVVGMAMGFAMILLQVKSPMLVSVGMYLPLETTFAIFVGGLVRGVTDLFAEKKGLNAAQRARVENTGVLMASGLIAGEALVGLVTATFNFLEWPLPAIFDDPSYVVGLVILALLAITSSGRVVRALALRPWRELHALAYAAAPFGLLHVALSPWPDVRLVASAAAIVGALLASRLVLRR